MRVFVSEIMKGLRMGFRIGVIFWFKIKLVNGLVNRFVNGFVERLIY